MGNLEDSTGQEEDQFRDTLSVATVLTVMIAKWFYRYNITIGALEALLKLIRLFFSLISTPSSSLSLIARSFLSFFPASMHTFKKILEVDENNFIKFVVCPGCHYLYTFDECFDTSGRQRKPKVCSYIAFPEHPHRSRRQICGNRLLAEVTLKSGKVNYYPRKYYCYKPISESLASLAKRVGFLDRCELWRLRKKLPNTL